MQINSPAKCDGGDECTHRCSLNRVSSDLDYIADFHNPPSDLNAAIEVYHVYNTELGKLLDKQVETGIARCKLVFAL